MVSKWLEALVISKMFFLKEKINEVIFSSEEISYADMMSIVSASKNIMLILKLLVQI